MKPARASVKFTYEDFLQFPDDGKRHEIIDGEHYVTPSPITKHQVVVGNLYFAIRNHLKGDPRGAVFGAPFDVIFSDINIVEPDILYISRDHSRVLTKENVKGSPDFVIEVLSPGTRKTDEITKRKLYERFDVSEYWIVDPDLDSVKVYRRESTGRFAAAIELTREREDTLTTPLLPGFAVELSEVFAEPM